MRAKNTQLAASEYDEMMTRECVDFSRYHPGVRHRQRLLLRLVKQVAPKEVMDVGCGRGELIHFLQQRLPAGVSFHGVDYSGEVVKENAKRFPGATFSVLNLFEPTNPPAKRELVVCSEVIEHLDDPYRGLKNLAGLVAPKGHLIVTCPVGPVYPTERHFGHTMHPDFKKLLSTAAASGLQTVKVFNWGFPLYALQKKATNMNPEWAIKNFANGSYSAKQIAVSQALYLANFMNLPNSPWGCQFVGLFRKS